jgi:hypothetical protein
LDHVGIKDTNTSSYISKAHGIGSEGGMFRLTFEGRKQAEQYIADIFNDELTGGWLTSSGSKKPSKKSAEQPSSTDASVAGWISHAATKELSEAIDHSVRVQLPLVDKALLALYGIHKSGYAEEVPLASIKAYLYGAFDVQVSSNALSNTLHRLRTEKSAKSSYINFRPNQGYKSTPSGRKYIEDTLLKQPQSAPIDQSAGSNGATQP